MRPCVAGVVTTLRGRARARTIMSGRGQTPPSGTATHPQLRGEEAQHRGNGLARSQRRANGHDWHPAPRRQPGPPRCHSHCINLGSSISLNCESPNEAVIPIAPSLIRSPPSTRGVGYTGGFVPLPDPRTGACSPLRRSAASDRWRDGEACPCLVRSVNGQQPTYSLTSPDVDHWLPPQAPTGCEDTRPVLGAWLPTMEENHVHENGSTGLR